MEGKTGQPISWKLGIGGSINVVSPPTSTLFVGFKLDLIGKSTINYVAVIIEKLNFTINCFH
jgi:hypothetical protein